jgi:anaerobic ribonucleoside-triphosphate reductase
MNQITNGCVKCPKCGHKRFDPICGSCERRQCGYVAPKAAALTDGQSS